MKHKELIDKIDEQIMKNRVDRRFSNVVPVTGDSLRENNNLLGRIKTVLKSADNDYEKGLNDCWEFVKSFILLPSAGGMDAITFKNIFGHNFPSEMMRIHTYQEARNKIEAYEQKKKAEEEQSRIVVGDIVVNEHWNIPFIVTEFKNGFIKGIDDKGEPHKFIWPNDLIHKVGSGSGLFDRFKMDKE